MNPMPASATATMGTVMTTAMTVLDMPPLWLEPDDTVCASTSTDDVAVSVATVDDAVEVADSGGIVVMTTDGLLVTMDVNVDVGSTDDAELGSVSRDHKILMSGQGQASLQLTLSSLIRRW